METDKITVYTFAPPQFLGSGRMANASLKADENTNDDCVFIAMALGLALEQGPTVFTKAYKSLIAKASDKLYRHLKSKYQELIPNSIGPTEYANLTVLEDIIDRQILVFDVETLLERWSFKRSGCYKEVAHYLSGRASEHPPIIMLKQGAHVHFVKSLKGLLGADNVCTKCHMVYEGNHDCNNRQEKTEKIESKPQLIPIQPDTDKLDKRIKGMVTYDIETVTNGD